MINKNKGLKILDALSSDNIQANFAEFDKQVENLKSGLKEKIQVQSLHDVQNQIDKFQKRLNIDGMVNAIDRIRDSMDARFAKMIDSVNNELELRNIKFKTLNDKIDSLDSTAKAGAEKLSQSLQSEIDDLKNQLLDLESNHQKDSQKWSDHSTMMKEMDGSMGEMMTELSSRIDALESVEPQEIKDWQETIDKLRAELMSKIGNVGGGSMNRNIAIGGNPSVLTKYTDINIKPGNNVTLTYSNNDTTKFLDLTITASGGSGVTRSIASTAVSSTVGAVSSTDYVVLCTQGVQITLPTAVGNTNLYTIKNVSPSSVMVATTGGETIDAQANIIMPVQYTSVDIISDSTNWNIT